MRFSTLNQLIIIGCCLQITNGFAGATCSAVNNEVLKILHQQSDAFSAKDACTIGDSELKIRQYKHKYAHCFNRNPPLDAEHDGYEFSDQESCIQVKEQASKIQARMETYRSTKVKCKLGAAIIELKQLINHNLHCLVTKRSTSPIIDPTRNHDVEYR